MNVRFFKHDFLSCSEENLKFNRFRSLIDISLLPEARTAPPAIQLEDPEIQKIISLDMHANNYRDGEWGSFRHFVVKDGKRA